MIAETSVTAYQAGSLSLDLETRELSGPHGHVVLYPMLFTLMERLMRRNGAIISHDALVSAVWPNPDDEPENALGTIRDKISRLRGLVDALGVRGPSGVDIVSEAGVGYYIKLRVRKCRI